MRLILVRHGEAYAGFSGVIGGVKGCTGLTPQGRSQAEALCRRFEATHELTPDVLLASVLPRAIETAEIIAPGLGLDVASHDCDLCEVHVGEADGMEWSEYRTRYEAFDMEAEPDRVFAPAGDSWNSFHERVRGALHRIATEYEGKMVVAVCHAGVIAATARVLFDLPHPGTGARLQPTNTGLTEWDHDAHLDRWTLHRFNDAHHLVDPVLPGEIRPDGDASVAAMGKGQQ